ncbi:MAG TPA: hypothetical protein VFG45_03310 [Candidatus Nitrosocosmicus sp.]|nr:hypothetical protein [Candidatus Nitrosocosmicus sp.]
MFDVTDDKSIKEAIGQIYDKNKRINIMIATEPLITDSIIEGKINDRLPAFYPIQYNFE